MQRKSSPIRSSSWMRKLGCDSTRYVMTWTVGKKIGLGFGLALLFLVVVSAISYRSTTKLTETTDAVTQTHIVLEELAALLQALTDAETGQRGYIITAREAYLEPYHAGLA